MIPDDVAASFAVLSERRPDARFDVRWHATLPSTMDVASSLVHHDARHGLVIVADEQTAGRGRRGSSWASPPGAGLYFSFVARPESPASGLSLLTLAAGVAVRDGVLAATGLAADLKWPNDLIVGKRKLAGVLAEGIAIGTPGQAVIIGVGLNLQPAAYPPDVSVRATSIEGELGRPVERAQVFADILISLWDRLAQLAESPGDILQAWRRGSPNATGTRVEWDGRHGVTAGIDETGALLVTTAGRTERIIAGELRWML
jgi:BirA family biotin operon repressor/biotin-[acetyl-CoA-carboxylase] ligase